MDFSQDKHSITPGFPTYTEARAFLKAIDGANYLHFSQMREIISQQKGTPQDMVNWTNPDEWIPERLDGMEKELAFHIWHSTSGIVNPRHVRGAWYLSTKHQLIERNANDILQITTYGKDFVDNAKSKLTTEIDKLEGVLNILQAVSEHSPGRRSDILPAFIAFCNNYTNIRSESVYKSTLYDRMVNLIEREYVKRHSLTFFEITESGMNYLHEVSNIIPGRVLSNKQTDLNRLAKVITNDVRTQLLEYLGRMNPFMFEQLVGLLLEEMGYTNVQVTSPTNDKGVDVVADIELGISSIREVVQVKRIAGTVNRNVVDLLRGSLHRFDALRGTIITTGSFASGAKKAAFEKNAAPITLIDGEKLIDLLMEYEIGITRKAVEFYEFDDSKLHQFEEID